MEETESGSKRRADDAAMARIQALIASRKGGVPGNPQAGAVAVAGGQAAPQAEHQMGAIDEDPFAGLVGRGQPQGQPQPQPPAPTQEEIAAAERAVQVREAVLQAQDNAILGTVLINIYERFGPAMTTTERLIMLREIEVYNPAYARRVKALMQVSQQQPEG